MTAPDATPARGDVCADCGGTFTLFHRWRDCLNVIKAERDALAQRVRVLEAAGERFGMRYPQPHEKYVVVADETVSDLKANPSRPVTVRIVEADRGKLDMTFTEVDDAACDRVVEALVRAALTEAHEPG